MYQQYLEVSNIAKIYFYNFAKKKNFNFFYSKSMLLFIYLVTKYNSNQYSHINMNILGLKDIDTYSIL